VPHCKGDGRPQVTLLGAAVEPRALIPIRQHGFVIEKFGNGIGELNFTTGTRCLLLKNSKDARREQITSRHRKGRRRIGGFWFFDN